MATRYEKLCEMVSTKRQRWFESRNRCFNLIQRFAVGLHNFLEAPDGRIVYLHWNNETQEFEGAEGGRLYTSYGALWFDEEKNEWLVGFCVYLSSPTALSPSFVAFGIRLSDLDGVMRISIAEEAVQIFDPASDTQWEALFQKVLRIMEQAFEGGHSDKRRIGFRAESFNSEQPPTTPQ